ncbi:MAG: molecular chaperone [Gammaproteobacteria bacterium]
MRYTEFRRRVPGAMLGVLMLLTGVNAHASMALSNVIVHFEPGQPTRQDIDVENLGDEPLYVAIKPHVVHNPGTHRERRELIRDPRAAGLLVTPNRLVIAPGARKRLRLVNLNPGASDERVYRVAVTPVVGELTAEQSGLKVLIGYEVLVLAQPTTPSPDLLAQRIGGALHFENRGNTNVLLREGHQCTSVDAPLDTCTPLASKRLYPGNRWQLELDSELPVIYHLGTGTQNRVVHYE